MRIGLRAEGHGRAPPPRAGPRGSSPGRLGLGVPGVEWAPDRRLACCPNTRWSSRSRFRRARARSLRVDRPGRATPRGPRSAPRAATQVPEGSRRAPPRRGRRHHLGEAILELVEDEHDPSSECGRALLEQLCEAGVGRCASCPRPVRPSQQRRSAVRRGHPTIPCRRQRARRAVHAASGRRPPAAPRTFRPHSGRTEARSAP